MSNPVVDIEPANGVTPLGSRTCGGMVITKFGPREITGPAVEGLMHT